MADEEATEAVETQEQPEQGTVSRDEYESIKKAQAGSDKKVRELTAQVEELKGVLKQKEQESQEAEQTWQQKLDERIVEMEKQMESERKEKNRAVLRAKAQQMLSESGVKVPSFLDRFIADSEEDTVAAVQEYIEDKKTTKTEAADEFAKRHGRKPAPSKREGNANTIDDYTDEQVDAMTDEEFEAVMDRTKQARASQ